MAKISKTTETALRRKAKSSNLFNLTDLKSVYRRGQGAFLGAGSRPGTTMAQWAMGRVKSFVSGKGGARKADADLLGKKKTKKKA